MEGNGRGLVWGIISAEWRYKRRNKTAGTAGLQGAISYTPQRA